jgi:hypothetical protein
VDQVTNTAQCCRYGSAVAQITERDFVLAMNVDARAGRADQHADSIAGGASAVGDCGAEKSAGAGNEDQVARAAFWFCCHRPIQDA